LANILNLQRILQLQADSAAIFASVIKIKLQRQDGTPYKNHYIKIGKPVVGSERSLSGGRYVISNNEAESVTDGDGISYIRFFQNGLTTVELYDSKSATQSLANFQVKVFPRLTKDNLRILNIQGNLTTEILEVTSSIQASGVNLSNGYYTPLGTISERLYASVLVSVSSSGKFDLFIASTSNGIFFDEFTRIGDFQETQSSAGLDTTTSYIVGRPASDGTNITFLIRKDVFTISNSSTARSNTYVQWSASGKAPSSVTPKTINSLYGGTTGIITTPTFYPFFYLNGKWFTFELVSVNQKLIGRDLDSTSSAIDYTSSCGLTSIIASGVYLFTKPDGSQAIICNTPVPNGGSAIYYFLSPSFAAQSQTTAIAPANIRSRFAQLGKSIVYLDGAGSLTGVRTNSDTASNKFGTSALVGGDYTSITNVSYTPSSYSASLDYLEMSGNSKQVDYIVTNGDGSAAPLFRFFKMTEGSLSATELQSLPSDYSGAPTFQNIFHPLNGKITILYTPLNTSSKISYTNSDGSWTPAVSPIPNQANP
jgi:hypothetical protein